MNTQQLDWAEASDDLERLGVSGLKFICSGGLFIPCVANHVVYLGLAC